ncbi:hypothetical protein [Chryseobacterium hispalense]|uniref:hypothetical protein n=1 Tax=Chryseobacterium hispalense TaxID=1453492 RepID=UPI003919F171
MSKKLLLIIILTSVWQSLFCQTLENKCPNNLIYFAYSLPIDGEKWYVPIKYEIQGGLINLKIRHKDNDELFIRFKIIKKIICNFKNIDNSNLKYKVLTYDEETGSYEKKISEIEFKFSNGKGEIYIQHPNLPLITSEATSIDKTQ